MDTGLVLDLVRGLVPGSVRGLVLGWAAREMRHLRPRGPWQALRCSVSLMV